VQLTIIGDKGFGFKLPDACHDWGHIVQVQALEIPAVIIAGKCQKMCDEDDSVQPHVSMMNRLPPRAESPDGRSDRWPPDDLSLSRHSRNFGIRVSIASAGASAVIYRLTRWSSPIESRELP
jgi:hypothetical protein